MDGSSSAPPRPTFRAAAADRSRSPRPRLYWLGGLSGRRYNDLRAGGGLDSRNVFYRFFGMERQAIRELTGGRQRDSGVQPVRRRGTVCGTAPPRPTPDGELSAGRTGWRKSIQRPARRPRTPGLHLLSRRNWTGSTPGTRNSDSARSIPSAAPFHSTVRPTAAGGRGLRSPTRSPPTSPGVNVYGYTGQATAHAGTRLLASFGGEFV